MTVMHEFDHPSTTRLTIDPDQTSALAIIAQGAAAGATWDEYENLTRMLDGDSLAVAQILYHRPLSQDATPAIRNAAERLMQWVQHLRQVSSLHDSYVS
jgi:hypothetical protein